MTQKRLRDVAIVIHIVSRSLSVHPLIFGPEQAKGNQPRVELEVGK